MRSHALIPFVFLRENQVANLIYPGKQWHPVKKAFRPKAGNTSYEKRKANDEAIAATKAKEKEMKEEKEAARQVIINRDLI